MSSKEDKIDIISTLCGTQITRSNKLAFSDGAELVGLDPLAVTSGEIIHQQKLVRVVHVTHRQSHSSARTVHSDTSRLVSFKLELVVQ